MGALVQGRLRGKEKKITFCQAPVPRQKESQRNYKSNGVPGDEMLLKVSLMLTYPYLTVNVPVFTKNGTYGSRSRNLFLIRETLYQLS